MISGLDQLSENLKSPVSQLLEEKAALFKEKINFKMPGGLGFKPHQDSQAGWNVYANFFVSVFVSIDQTTIENGCLEICDRSHASDVYKSWEPLSEKDVEKMPFLPIPTEPGDIIFFDCFAPHQSNSNKSNKSRRVYYATYNRLSEGDNLAQYYADKYKSYPPDIDREQGKTYIFKV